MPDATSRLLAPRSPSQSRPIETDVPALSVGEPCNPNCTHPKVLMTAQADGPHPDIMEPDLHVWYNDIHVFAFHVHVRHHDYETDPNPRVPRTLTPDPYG